MALLTKWLLWLSGDFDFEGFPSDADLDALRLPGQARRPDKIDQIIFD